MDEDGDALWMDALNEWMYGCVDVWDSWRIGWIRHALVGLVRSLLQIGFPVT